jgi:hypothetical protein
LPRENVLFFELKKKQVGSIGSIRLAYQSKSASHGTMFFSHNKSASTSVKNKTSRTQP